MGPADRADPATRAEEGDTSEEEEEEEMGPL